MGSYSQNVAQTVLCCLNYSSFFSETYLEGTSSLLSVMKRLDCCVPVQSIKVENGCDDTSIIMNEPEYYAQRLILLSSCSGYALYV